MTTPTITLTRGPLAKLCTIHAEILGESQWWDFEFDDLPDLYNQLKHKDVPWSVRVEVLRKACRQAEGLR